MAERQRFHCGQNRMSVTFRGLRLSPYPQVVYRYLSPASVSTVSRNSLEFREKGYQWYQSAPRHSITDRTEYAAACFRVDERHTSQVPV